MQVKIVSFQEHHITARYVSWLNDPEIVRLSEQRHVKHTEASCRAWLSQYIGHAWNRIWAIEVDGVHVGNVTAFASERDRANGTIEVSNLIGERSAWGKGVGTQSCRLAINELLNAGWRKVWIGTLSVNHGELRIMEKLGMQPDCVIQQHFVIDGQPVDEVRRMVLAPNRV